MVFLHSRIVEALVRDALAEDIGTGDITTMATVQPDAEARAVMVAKSEGVIAGLPVVMEVFNQVSSSVPIRLIRVENRVQEGERVQPGSVIAEIEGMAQTILMGERVA